MLLIKYPLASRSIVKIVIVTPNVFNTFLIGLYLPSRFLCKLDSVNYFKNCIPTLRVEQILMTFFNLVSCRTQRPFEIYCVYLFIISTQYSRAICPAINMNGAKTSLLSRVFLGGAEVGP